MDLSTSETKLEQEQYSSPHDFIADLHHIFENARTYNSRDSEVMVGGVNRAGKSQRGKGVCLKEYFERCI